MNFACGNAGYSLLKGLRPGKPHNFSPMRLFWERRIGDDRRFPSAPLACPGVSGIF
jgi:hypothetical protein